MLNLILNQENQEKLKQWLSGVTSWVSLTVAKTQELALRGKETIENTFAQKEHIFDKETLKTLSNEVLSRAKEFAAPHYVHVSNNLQAGYQKLQKTANSPRMMGYRKKANMIFSDIYHQLDPVLRKQMAEIKFVLANEMHILMKNNTPIMQKLFEQLKEMQHSVYHRQQYEKYESILDSINCNTIVHAIDNNDLSSESLDLRHCYLTRIPGSLLTVPAYQSFWASLKFLNLEWNNLQSLPEEISQLAALEKLLMNHNSFQSLPSAIGTLSELKVLKIADNPIESFPAEIEQLKKLTTFEIDQSSLALPQNLEQLNSGSKKKMGA